MRARAWLLVAVTLLLAGCSREEVTRSMGAGFESWCRNTPDRCTSSAERR